MPVFRSAKGVAPDWGEVDFFDILRLKPEERHLYERAGRKEKLILGDGRCLVSADGRKVELRCGETLDLFSIESHFEVHDVFEDTVLIRICGSWGEEVGGCGTFGVRNVEGAAERGDPTSYSKTTKLDNHYHDCDEYWIIFEGRGIAVSEGRRYEVGPGDCIATRAGDHHDFPRVVEPVRAIYFETSLRGLKRRGHLWEHTHGPPRARGYAD